MSNRAPSMIAMDLCLDLHQAIGSLNVSNQDKQFLYEHLAKVSGKIEQLTVIDYEASKHPHYDR